MPHGLRVLGCEGIESAPDGLRELRGACGPAVDHRVVLVASSAGGQATTQLAPYAKFQQRRAKEVMRTS
jgi:hypothetical protein